MNQECLTHWKYIMEKEHSMLTLDEYLSADFTDYTIVKNSGSCKGEIVAKYKSKAALNWHCFRWFNKPLYNPLSDK